MKIARTYLKRYLSCAVVLTFLILNSVSAFGATIRVPTDQPTIQAGIDAATAGDIVLVADGTYTGAGNKNVDFKGKAITVRCKNGPENCIIDCEGDGRGFYFHSGEKQSSVLDGFTITNGQADYGGGIRSLSSPTIINCKIIGNTAEKSGGGIDSVLFGAKIINCIIAGNMATWGGGIHINSAEWTEVINSTIFGNTATIRGGGVLITKCSPTITNSILWKDSPQEVFVVVDGNPAPKITYCDIQDSSVTGSTIIHSDPLFVDVSDPSPVKWDPHLLPSSPCIDAGTSKGAPDHDIDGDSRPQGAGYDMGADEYLEDNDDHPPDAATLISPKGTINDNTPTYTWNAVKDSTWYRLWVDDSTGNCINKWYKAEDAGCAGGTGECSVTPTTVLADGSCKWWIRTWNDFGNGPWSDGLSFNTNGCDLPGKATLISPKGTINDNTPTYTWNAVKDSTWYRLWVDDSSGNRIKKWYTAEQANCGDGTGECSVTHTTTLADGSCTWWIRTWNDCGNGPWSDELPFTVDGDNDSSVRFYNNLKCTDGRSFTATLTVCGVSLDASSGEWSSCEGVSSGTCSWSLYAAPPCGSPIQMSGTRTFNPDFIYNYELTIEGDRIVLKSSGELGDCDTAPPWSSELSEEELKAIPLMDEGFERVR